MLASTEQSEFIKPSPNNQKNVDDDDDDDVHSWLSAF